MKTEEMVQVAYNAT